MGGGYESGIDCVRQRIEGGGGEKGWERKKEKKREKERERERGWGKWETQEECVLGDETVHDHGGACCTRTL